MLENVHWLGHASIKITNGKVVYVDPYQINGGDTADLILITHDHYDHLSLEDVRQIQGDETIIVVPNTAVGGLSGQVHSVKIGDQIVKHGIEIEVVPAYNIGKQFHPKEKQYVGYVFRSGNVTYYHAGDTDLIPEMKDIRADVAFLPVGGTYTMTAEEASAAAKDIHPKVAVPIHFGAIVGSDEDAQKFASLCECEVQILTPER